MRRVAALIALLALLVTLFPMAATAAPSSPGGLTRVIVVFDDSVTNPAAAAADLAGTHGFAPSVIYQHALRGFAASVPPAAVDALTRDRRVAFVEHDQIVRLDAQTVPTGIDRTFASDNTAIDIDGIDDHRVDVDVAIIDTGIDLDHPDLNVVASTNCTGGGPFRASCGSGGDDDNGHGTHVAGTVAALDNGIGVVGMAPGARLHAVKVLRADGSGYLSWITAGIDWVTARAGTIEVANMSLGCECTSSAMDQAIANSVDAGVAYAVAAGNSDADARTHSPANHPDVLTVSALADFDGTAGGLGSPTCRTDEDDTLANFSNFGPAVEIAAPGVCILSSVPGGGYDTFSGTSMASPHAAGALAIVASGSGDPKSDTDVKNLYGKLITNGNLNWTDDSGDGIKERLLDVSSTTVFNPATVAGGGGGGGDTTPPAAPTGLAATAGDARVDLDWNSNSEADLAGYDVYRSQTSGSGYTKINGSLVTASDYADATASNGETYYYVVRAVDSSGNASANSNEATASPTGGGGGGGSGIELSVVSAYKVRGIQHADLSWSGATSTSVDVYRNGSLVATTANDGAHTDNIGARGGGSYTYKVCEAGTDTCSNEATASY